MQKDIFDFISATFGISVAITLAVIGVALWLTQYITRKVTEFRCEHKAIKEKQDSHDAKMRSVDEDLTYCKTSLRNTQIIVDELGEIRRDLSYLKGTIDIIKSGSNPLMGSHSPVSLNEEGLKVVEELGGERIVDDNWEQINNNLTTAGEKTPYDIQQFCIESVSVEPEKYFCPDDLDRIKNYAFSKGLPLQLFLRVLGLLIRDRYFREHNIPLSEIDNTSH